MIYKSNTPYRFDSISRIHGELTESTQNAEIIRRFYYQTEIDPQYMGNHDCHGSGTADGSNAVAVPRRRWLLSCGSVALASVAGCLGDSDDTDANGSSEPNGTDGENTDESDASAYENVAETEMAWPRKQTGTYQNSYVPEAEGAVTEFERAEIGTISFDIISAAYAHYDGKIYAQTDETISEYDRDGTKEWERERPQEFRGEPIIADDGVYYITDSHQFVTLDRETGERSRIRTVPDDWELSTSGTDEQRYNDGDLYIIESRGYDEYEVGAYDLESESFAWRETFPYTGRAIEIVDDRLVLTEYDNTIGGTYSGIRTFDRESGTEQWHRELDETPATIVSNGSLLYALYSSRESRLYAFDLEDGNQRFEIEPDVDVEEIAVDDRHVYYAVDEGYAAFDAETGEHEWTFQTISSVESGVVVTDDAIYLSTGERLHVVDPTSGDELANHEADIRDLDRLYGLSLSGDRLWAIVDNGAGYENYLVAFEPTETE